MRLISRGYSGPTKTSLYLYTQLILIAILFGFSQLMAQQENDSLHNILFGDTMLSQHERLSLTLNLAELFTTKTPDKAMSYCQAVLSFSDNLDQQDPELFLRANKLLASLQNRLCLYAKADSTYKVIETTFSENTDLKQLANHNFLMGQNYYDRSLYKLAMERYENALQAYENIKDKEGSAACLQGLGSVVANWADYEQALGYLQRARDIYQRLENYKGLAAITLSLGVVMEHWGKYDRALDYYTQSLRYFKINNEKRQQINLHLHIGDIYLKQKSPQLALQQYNHAKKLEKASAQHLWVSLFSAWTLLFSIILPTQGIDT